MNGKKCGGKRELEREKKSAFNQKLHLKGLGKEGQGGPWKEVESRTFPSSQTHDLVHLSEGSFTRTLGTGFSWE